MTERILVGMSGGVDSSVAAALLLRAGHEVAGAYIRNWAHEGEAFGDCPWRRDIEEARAAATHLGIEFQIVNLIDAYRHAVVEPMLGGYAAGITPNPDALCNREIKFGAFARAAFEGGFDAVATGHYARRQPASPGRSPGPRWDLWEGADKGKDQSYFLALLAHEQIARARFPIGQMTKPEVRRLAREFGLPNADRPDSQGICFIGRVRMTDFLRAFLPDAPGPIVDRSGRTLGEHRGLHLFTLGQRRGLRVPSNTAHRAYVVVEKRASTRELVIDLEGDVTPGLHARRCALRDLSALDPSLERPRTLLARPRYRAPSAPARFRPLGDGRAELVFETPQRALTPGQICALYEGERLLGGSFFEWVEGSAIPSPAGL